MDKRGITLVELLIVIGILLIIAIAASPLYGNLQVSAQLNESTTKIIQDVRNAREYSVARLNNTAHGIYIDIQPSGDDSIIVFQGATYATRDTAYDRQFTLGPALSLSTTISGTETVFELGSGVPSQIGTITLTHEVNGTRTIDLNAYGIADQN